MLKNLLLVAVLIGAVACSNSLSTKEEKAYIEKGKEVAQASFMALSKQLTAQMKEGGPSLALPFCNTQALPITHQLSEKFNVTIKRTSDKLRNSKNEPTLRELEIINGYKNALTENKELSPIVEINNNNNKHFYAPIIIKEKCLVCHGNPGDNINAKTDSIIKSYYPNDLAIGYAEGDVRGIWSITFKN